MVTLAKGTNGVLLFFSVAMKKEEMLLLRDFWIKTFLEKFVSLGSLPRHQHVIVGTMTDQENYRQISYDEGKQFASSLGMHYMEVNVQSNLNIKETMDLLLSNIIHPEKIPRNGITIGPKLGEGGFGVVYKGIWNERGVAVKAIKSAISTEAFQKEIYSATSLSHPNIVQSFGVSEEEGSDEIMLVMELMDQSLHDIIHPSGRLKMTLARQSVVHVALDVAKGLDYLHSLSPKIIHRDLKTANILLDNNQRAKLSDFGTARALNNNSLATTVTGTPYYMAPEVLDGVPCDEKADIYSFGAVLYEMTTGSCLPLLFDEAKCVNKIRENVTYQKLQELVVSCCKTDPKKRPSIQQCMDVLKKLELELQKF
eukprot:TRINITY_DN2828_c0_g4_i1.p1 TRINITY_DN2828_c0_g4~~TRINITY_DN2828_c0_g4_i1.p1  ORF type:complete len:368 (+),score=42.77 TRINITY_DN2828_c0_g4_i1:261-1364(+)